MEFEVIDREPIFVKVMEQVQARIRDGAFKPGDQLPTEKELAHALGVSRTAVREALSALKVLGLVESKQGSGNFVGDLSRLDPLFGQRVGKMITSGNPLQIVEARGLLEINIAFLAAQRRTDDDLASMEHALKAMKRAITEGDESTSAGVAFHLAVAKATHNPVLMAMTEVGLQRMHSELWDVMREYGRAIPRMKYLAEHEDLLSAIRQGDPEAARLAAQRHSASMETDLVGGEVNEK